MKYLLMISLAVMAFSCQKKQPQAVMEEQIDGVIKAIPLPEDFDYELNMVAKVVDGEKFHGPRASVRLCEKLLANGTAEDIANVEKMIPGILSGQQTDPTLPHFGGFKWEIEMEAVEDLNAVQFLLHSLIPIVIDYGDKLKKETVDDIKESIQLGLQNIKKVDVGLKYTNIVLKDINNSCLGGELLGDEEMARRGYEKLVRWMAFTDQSGGAYEFNSTPYTAVAIDVLYRLSKYVKDPEAKMRAQLMLARISLGAALHQHNPTRRWAGPHGRAYHRSMIGDGGAHLLDKVEMNSFEEWIENGKVPYWLSGLMNNEVLDDQVIETVGKSEGISTSTYKGLSYSLGVASRNMSNQANRYIAWQTNSLALHYKDDEAKMPGAIFTRYLTNDHWLGYFSAGIGRGTTGLLPDEGYFQGVQDENRAIGLYTPIDLNAKDHFSSAKAVVGVPRWKTGVDKVWSGGSYLENFPVQLETNQSMVIETGEIMFTIKPFTLTQLGTSPQVVVDLKSDETLTVEFSNYKGPLKTFWELSWPGAFYQGQPQNAFYIEVAEKGIYNSPQEFAATVDKGSFIDDMDDRSTYSGSEELKWKIGYERDGRKLGMEVDLFDTFRPTKRWTHLGDLKWPMLESKYARQNDSGLIELNGNTLTCGANPAWIYASPDNQVIVVAYHGPDNQPLQLDTSMGKLSLDGLDMGMIVIDHGLVTIEALGIKGTPILEGLNMKN